MRRHPTALALLLLLIPSCAGVARKTPRKPGDRCPAPESLAAPSSMPASVAGPTRPVLIRAAVVWTAARDRGEILKSTDVLVRDGRVAAVGRGLAAPAGALVIDASGRHLTPGLIDPHSHLGVFPLPYLSGQRDGNESTTPASPNIRAADAIWPQDPAIARALAAGITTALVVPGSTNLVGGQGVTIRLVPGRAAADLVFPGAPMAVKMACGENPIRSYRKKGGPATRMGSVARVRELFRSARAYRKKWRRYRKQHAGWCEARGRPGSNSSSKNGKLPPESPKRDAALETLVQVLEGRAQVHWHCYRADEMLLMMSLAREYGFTVRAFHHAVEAYKIRDALRTAGTAVVTWVNWWGFKIEAYDNIPENPALLVADDVLTALHTDSPVVAQRFVHEAAQAYFRGRAQGLTLREGDAIKLVTLNPARVLGVDDRIGSIEVGKLADLVLWDGHPFSVYTRVERVLVGGRVVFDRARGPRPSDFELGMVPAATPLAKKTAPVRPPEPPPRWLARRRRADPKAPALAIVGGRVLAMDGSPPRFADVVVRGDRIALVAPDARPPAGAEVIDARRRIVTPGLLAVDSTLGLVEVAEEDRARDDRPPAVKEPIRASLRVWDGLNPASASIPVARTNGFTTAIIRPGGGMVSGQGAAYDLVPGGLSHESLRLVAPVAMRASLADGGVRLAGGRALAQARLRRLLDDARALTRNRAAIKAGRFRKLSAPLSELEAMVSVVEGRLPLMVHVHRASDILATLRLAREQRVRLVLTGGAEAWRVAPALAVARVPVLVDVDRTLPESFQTLAGRFDNAARLHQAGVVVGFSADGASRDARLLRQLAGIAVAWGLPRDAALRGLTSVPATLFGLEDRGLLRPGALANVVVWSGDPLELGTRVLHLVVGGKRVPLVSRQTRLRDRYR
jgi:imidazolonepropionase-like amidohydrolase